MKTYPRWLIVTLAAASMSGGMSVVAEETSAPPVTAPSNDVESLKRQNTELQQRVDKLAGELEQIKTELAEKPSAAPAAALKKKPVTSGLDVEIYGYVKLDAAYDSQRISFGDYLRWVESEERIRNQHQFNLTANETRLGVRIKGPGTDLSFSLKGIGAKMCKGDRNIPDGEVFSCPVKTSVNGRIQFNTPTLYSGTKFENVCLEFKDGKVVNAMSNNTTRLNQILDTDPGARYTGEFSLGLNPYILNPMCDILFDEKIAGSLHLTPGQAYEECGNGNRSAVHWDMVLIQRPEWGGGEVWFDGELIRKDGLFLPPELKGLNPGNWT